MNRHEILCEYMCVYVCVSMYVRVCTQTHMHAHTDSASPVKFYVSFFLLNVFMTEFKKEISIERNQITTGIPLPSLYDSKSKDGPTDEKRQKEKDKTSHSICCFLFCHFVFWWLSSLSSSVLFHFYFVLNGVVLSRSNLTLFSTGPRLFARLK